MQTLNLAWRHHAPITLARRPIAGSRRYVGPIAAFLVTLVLLAMLPTMAAAPTVAGEPHPLPAPAPVSIDGLASRGS